MGTGLLDLLPEVNELLSKVLNFVTLTIMVFLFLSPLASGDPSGRVCCFSHEF
jgi:hypothetical protein